MKCLKKLYVGKKNVMIQNKTNMYNFYINNN